MSKQPGKEKYCIYKPEKAKKPQGVPHSLWCLGSVTESRKVRKMYDFVALNGSIRKLVMHKEVTPFYIQIGDSLVVSPDCFLVVRSIIQKRSGFFVVSYTGAEHPIEEVMGYAFENEYMPYFRKVKEYGAIKF